jgi:hypothetical protein
MRVMIRLRHWVSVPSCSQAEKTQHSLSSSLATRRRVLGDRLFATQDEQAHTYGWQVFPTKAGLGRRYRDPRFDSLMECATCQGIGGQPDALCGDCFGLGRITLQQPNEGRPSR